MWGWSSNDPLDPPFCACAPPAQIRALNMREKRSLMPILYCKYRCESERELHPQLDLSGSRYSRRDPSKAGRDRSTGIREHRQSARNGEIRMIRQIEYFGAKLKRSIFTQRYGFRHGSIQFAES